MYFLLKKFGFASLQLCFFFRGVVVLCYCRTFLWLSPVGVIYFVLKISEPNLPRGTPIIWWFLVREVSPYTSGFGPFGSFLVLCPCISPPENQTNICWKIGCFGRWSGFISGQKKWFLWKGGYFPPHFPGGRFFRYLFTIGPWSVNGGRSHPIRPPFRWTQQHLGSWRSGPGSVSTSSRGWPGWWGSGVWTHKYLFEKALIKRVQNFRSSRGILGILEDLWEKDVFLVDIAFAFFKDRMFHQGGRIVGCSILKHMHLL